MCLYNKWIKNPIGLSVTNHSDNYPTPINLSYFWGFGSLAGFALAIQLFTGIFLAMHYTPEISLAFISVEHIMRDVVGGVGLRYMHANGASMFFIIVYCHMFRGLYYGSYLQPRAELWYSGVLIFFLMMATGFMGYVLPWGQMSFWGATVITNLFSAVPFIGKYIVQILWGGFSVENPTLNRFFSLHYLLPFIILALVLTHLILLHKDGSSNPLGIESNLDRVFFLPYFYFKDFLGACFFAAFFSFFVIYAPNFLGHPDNYIEANPMVTPAHIVPEWYFLPFYAILRTIPDKLGGVILMVFAILILFFLPNLDTASIRSNFFKPFHIVLFWFLVSDGIILGWVGQEVVETPFIEFSNIITPLYFIYFIIALPFVSNLEKFFLKALLITPSNSKVSPFLQANFGGFFIILLPNTLEIGFIESWYTYSNIISLLIVLLAILTIAMSLKPTPNTIQVVTMLAAIFFAISLLCQIMNTSYLQLQEEISSNFFMTLTGNFFMNIGTLFISVLLFGFASKIILEANSKIEFTLLILAIFLSAVFLNNVNSFLNIIILLECFAFASYILVGFERTSKFSAIAGVKYLLVSSAPTGLFILGIGLLYFLLGTLDQTALILFLTPIETLLTSEGFFIENLLYAASADANSNDVLTLIKNLELLISGTPADTVHLLEFFNKTWRAFLNEPKLIIETYPELQMQISPYLNMSLNDIYRQEFLRVFKTPTPDLINTVIKSKGAFDLETVGLTEKVWAHTYMAIQDSIYVLNMAFSKEIPWSGDPYSEIHPALRTYWMKNNCIHSLNWGEYVYGRHISLNNNRYTPIPKSNLLQSDLFGGRELFLNKQPRLLINALLTDPQNPLALENALRQLEAYQKVFVYLEKIKAGYSKAENQLHRHFIEELLTRPNTEGLENILSQDGPAQLGAVCLATSTTVSNSNHTAILGEINWRIFEEYFLLNLIGVIGQIYFIPITAYLIICSCLFFNRNFFIECLSLKENLDKKDFYDTGWLMLFVFITSFQLELFIMFFKALWSLGGICKLYSKYVIIFPIYNYWVLGNIEVLKEWNVYFNLKDSSLINYLHFVATEMSQQNVNFAMSSNETLFTAKPITLPTNKHFTQYLGSLEQLVATTGVTSRHTVDLMKVEWVQFMTLPSLIEKSFPYISEDLGCKYYTPVSQYCLHRMALIHAMLEPFDTVQKKIFNNGFLTDHQIWVYKFRSLTKTVLGIQYEIHFLNQWAWGFNLHPKTGAYYSLQDNPVDSAVFKELHPNFEKVLHKYNCVAIREFFYVVQANDKSINQMPAFKIPHFFNEENIHVIGTPKFVDAIIFPQIGGKKDLIFASKPHLYAIAEASNRVLSDQTPIMKIKVGSYTVGELHEKGMSDFADFLWAQPKNQGLQIPNGGKIISYNDAIIPNTEKPWTPPSPPFAASSFASGLEQGITEIPNLNTFLTNIFIPNMTNFFVLDTILITFAIFLIFINLFFKITAAPFHLWAPSVYGGAPLATLTFLSIFSKLTLFFFIIRLIFNTFDTLFINWQNLFLFVSLLSICSAILGAFGENSFKRFFIYSSTGHVGFMLLGISLLNITGLIATIEYLLLYVISSLIIWFIIIHLTKKTITLINLKGLSLNQPYLGLIFSTVMFSLSGLPPFGGFFVKYEIFLGLIEASFFYLGYILLLLTVISFFYYLRLIKIVFFEEQKIFSKNLNLNDIKLRIIGIIFFLIPFFLLFIENPITHFFKEIFIKSLY